MALLQWSLDGSEPLWLFVDGTSIALSVDGSSLMEPFFDRAFLQVGRRALLYIAAVYFKLKELQLKVVSGYCQSFRYLTWFYGSSCPKLARTPGV